MEVDIFPYTEGQQRRGKRSKKIKESLLPQKNLNDKNRKRKFLQVAETNFDEGDFHLSLTYRDEFLPKTIEEAEREVRNYIRRLRREMKRENVELKYMLVTSYRTEGEDGHMARVHHHLLVKKGLTRDRLEELWSRDGERLGFANADRIQSDANSGIARLCQYIMKHSTNKRSWTCSQNLERPVSRTNDCKYSRRQVQRLATQAPDFDFWERCYPGWRVADKDSGYEAVYHEETGWSIYLRFRKKE